MECSIGLCMNDFLMVATDRTNARSILVMKDGKYSGGLQIFAGFFQR